MFFNLGLQTVVTAASYRCLITSAAKVVERIKLKLYWVAVPEGKIMLHIVGANARLEMACLSVVTYAACSVKVGRS